MSVLLTILKILGIILLVIIGLILLLLLAVLFLPVRYRIDGEYEEDFHMEAKAGWLCRLLYFHFKIDGNEKIGILRVLGIPIMRFPPDENKEQRKKKTKSKKKTRKSKRKTRKSKKETENLKVKQTEVSQMLIQQSTKEDASEQPNGEQVKDEQTEEKYTKEKHTKKASLFERVKQFFLKFKQRLIQLPGKLKAAFSKIDDIKTLWMDENNKKSTGLILAEAKYLLLHYGPTKIKANIQFCMGDPATTGKVLGGLSMIPFLYQKDVHVIPDFVSEELYLKGYLTGKGHIRMLHLIRTLLHFHKDKNIITWIKDNL